MRPKDCLPIAAVTRLEAVKPPRPLPLPEPPPEVVEPEVEIEEDAEAATTEAEEPDDPDTPPERASLCAAYKGAAAAEA